jgi:hypothetical protein
MRAASVWGTLVVLAACQPSPSSSPETTAEAPTPAGVPDPEADRFAEPIEQAHGLSAWRNEEAVRADVLVELGGERVLQGELLMKTDMSRTRILRSDGTVLVWDGSDAWVAPAGAALARARFHALTWPFVLSAPMKLRGPGTYLESLGEKTLRGETYDSARLTFAPGVGDGPGEWYVLYRDPETERLHAIAFRASANQAETEPHAITFGGFVEIDGARIATAWTLWRWSEEAGIRGEPIGSVRLSNVAFTTPPDDAFAVSEDASRREVPAS